MKSNEKFIIFLAFLIFIISIGSAYANDLDNANATVSVDKSLDIELDDISEQSNEITVENWDDLQYYCSLNDKDYVLKLKENTSFYPTDPKDNSYKIQVNNNVTILGSSGAYFGDVSPNARPISYLAINVPENSGIGITLKGITFKWISTEYQPNALFLVMGGNANNLIENCYFTNSTLDGGHSSLVQIMRGKASVVNCTFTNITSDFGCLSVYDPKDDPTKTCTGASMEVVDSYFEGNYARTEPGCINNCGILVVRNSTFYKNSAFWWAGAIHTHGGANTTIYDSNFTDNLAGWNGGALYTYSYLQIYNTIFKGNNCTTNNGGGAIGATKYLHAPYIYVKDSLFEDNENLCWDLSELSTTGTGRGGAISLMDEGGLTVLNTTFIKNSASIGTAICAIAQGSYGSPDVNIIGNRFINHTRAGDVLVVNLAYGSKCVIEDNYYLGNSIEFSKLRLSADERVGDEVTLHIDASLKNPDYYDSDILEKSSYDVYLDGAYFKTVNSTDFALNLKNIEKAQVYVVPSISISKSNEVSVGLPKEYIYVSQKYGNDSNDGRSRQAPVSTLTKACQIARTSQNILIMDGKFSDVGINIDYNLTIVGEDNAVISSKGNIFNVTGADFILKNLTFEENVMSSTSNGLIKQSGGILEIEKCIFKSNSLDALIESDNIEVKESVFADNTGVLINSNKYLIESSTFDGNTANLGTKVGSLITSNEALSSKVYNSTFSNNVIKDGCIQYNVKKGNQIILTVLECSFVNNTASYSQVSQISSACIYMPKEGLLDVKSTLFVNNSGRGTYSSVILTAAETHVSDSVFLGNSFGNSNRALINAKSSSALKRIYCSGNWWGNNQDNYNVAPQIHSSSNCDNWIFLNASANTTSLLQDEKALVSFNLNNAYTKSGEVTYWNVGNLPDIALDISAVGGTSSDKKLVLVNGMAQSVFTLKDIEGQMIASCYNVDDIINFKEAKIKPDMKVSVNNISVEDDEIITVILPDNATGDLILNLTSGNITINKKVNSSNTIFTLPDLPADNYCGFVEYSGDDNYFASKQNIQFEVNKYNSTTKISVGQIELGDDVVLTINVLPAVTGNITLIINNKPENINLTESKANYTINAISKGDYEIEAIYNGNYKYLSSRDTLKFDVGKIDSNISASVKNIVYGQDAIIEVSLDERAKGNVTARVDGKNKTSSVNNGKAIINISMLNAGEKEVYIDYSGDDNFNPNNCTTSFNVSKAGTTLIINVNDIMIGQDENVEISVLSGVDGTITIDWDGKITLKSIPRTGKVTLILSDLSVGKHNVSAILNSTNYETIDNSTNFIVSDYKTPVWPNEGYDIQNRGKSPYDVDSNGVILWNYAADGKIIGNLAIDCDGNIYLITGEGVYSIDSNGKYRWNYSNSGNGNISGIAISRDLIIAPESGNAIYFINQSSGIKFGKSNIYQGSSLFAPIVDLNANIYVSSEFQYQSEDYKLVLIPYKLWENGGNPTLISLGDSEPVSSPVIVNENMAVVPCENGLKIIDLKNKVMLSSINGDTHGIKPIVGSGNMIYAVLDDSIAELTPNGNIIWKTKITGGAGNYMALDDEMGVYLINSLGNLYRYDLANGDESLVSNLNFTSGILIGNDGNVYVGLKDAFYAFTGDGNLLWKTNIGGEVIGSPIAGNDGIIYLTTQNNVYALSKGDLKDVNLTISVKDINCGDIEIINITIDNDATGNITVEVTSGSYKNISTLNGSDVSVPLYNLGAGNYTVKVSYFGDLRYKSANKTSYFNVNKNSVVINLSCVDMGQTANVTVNLPSDARGNVLVRYGDNNITLPLDDNGSVSFIVEKTGRSMRVDVIYPGDDKYDSANETIFINSTAKKSEFGNLIVSGTGLITASLFDSDKKPISNANITYKVNGVDFKTNTDEYGKLSVNGSSNSVVSIFYLGNEDILPTNTTLTLKDLRKPRVTTVINAEDYNTYAIDYNGGERGGYFEVILTDGSKPISNKPVKIGFNGKVYNTTTDEKGLARLQINLANAGTYTFAVAFLGDDDYVGAFAVQKITVTKKTTSISAPAKTFKASAKTKSYTVTLKTIPGSSIDGKTYLKEGKKVTITVGGKTYSAKTNAKGEATFKLSITKKGTYTATVNFAGDNTYQSSKATAKIKIN